MGWGVLGCNSIEGSPYVRPEEDGREGNAGEIRKATNQLK
jgi:hypothetical protein